MVGGGATAGGRLALFFNGKFAAASMAAGRVSARHPNPTKHMLLITFCTRRFLLVVDVCCDTHTPGIHFGY